MMSVFWIVVESFKYPAIVAAETIHGGYADKAILILQDTADEILRQPVFHRKMLLVRKQPVLRN